MQMSGGEKQLVNLARILVQQPQLILFDEPTSALDYGNVFKTLSLIKELSLQGFTIVMTTHNPDHPMLLHSALPNSRVSILNEHGKLQTGSAPEIITEANLKALYQQICAWSMCQLCNDKSVRLPIYNPTRRKFIC